MCTSLVSTLDSVYNTAHLVCIRYKDDLFSGVFLVNHIRNVIQQTTGERAKLPSISLKIGMISYLKSPSHWTTVRPVVLKYHKQILIAHEKKRLCVKPPTPSVINDRTLNN